MKFSKFTEILNYLENSNDNLDELDVVVLYDNRLYDVDHIEIGLDEDDEEVIRITLE